MIKPKFIKEGINYYDEGGFNYLMTGQGKPLIFLHGYGVSPASFVPLIKILSKKFKIIAPYMSAGWKKSEITGLSNFQTLSEHLAKLIEKLKLDRPTIMGFSMGGLPATITAINYPEKVGKLVIVDSVAIKINKKLWRVASDIVLELTKNLFSKEGYKAILSIYIDFLINFLVHPLILIKHAKYSADAISEQELLKLRNRTLILWGENDSILPLEYGKRLNQLIPNSELKVLAGGHIWGIIYPEVFLASLENFEGIMISRGGTK